MKVYVVWSVDSSPYAAFSSMHQAERLVEEKGNWWQFEELEIDRVPTKDDANYRLGSDE